MKLIVPAGKPFFSLLLAMLCCTVALRAQLYTGSVTGVVTDPSGAIVPAAKITLTDQDKGYVYTATTDNSGRYLLRSIPPGNYRIAVEAANFESQRRENVRLDVSQNITADFALTVGKTTESVVVNASAVQLQTEDAVTGQVVNRKFVNDLPLVDRNFTNLTYLAPGVGETDAPGTKNAQGGINFISNGSRNATADVLIDGASATNFDQNSGIQNVLYTPSVDSVEEFKVEQSNFSAEYGFAVGAIINVITRSGSNQFHGSGYEFFRDSAMDANNWFNNAASQPISALRRNNFGGTVGGPIRKDKTFFFFDYEGLRESTSTNSGFMSVPTLCMRGDPSATCPVGTPALGNFSELCTLQGGTFDNTGLCSVAAGQLWDPFTGVFSNNPDPTNGAPPGATRQNFIPFNNLATYQSPGSPALNGTPFQLAAAPGNLIDPAAAKLFALFPKPNLPVATLNDLQSGNFFSSGSNSDTNDQFDIKIDHRFSQNDLLSARYSQRKITSTSFSCFGTSDSAKFLDPCSSGPGTTKQYQLAINETHTFSPTVVMTVTFGYLRESDHFPGIGSTISNFNTLYGQSGLPSYLNNGFNTTPSIAIASYSSGNAGHNLGTADFSITREGQDAYHLGGSVGWVRGKHEFKAGSEWRARRINHGNPGWPSGFFGFDQSGSSQISSETAESTGVATGGDGLASFLMGVGSFNGGTGGCTPCQQGFNNFVSTQSFQFGEFVQDTYKVTPKLTLNIGLRYELNTPRTERFNRMDWLNPTGTAPLQLTAAQLAVAQTDGVSGSALQALGTLQGFEVFVGPKNRQNYYTDHKDIQPRFGFAYQFLHGFVVRGGYGIYYSTPRSGAAGTGPWGYQGFNIQPPWLTTFNLDHTTPYNRLSNTSCLSTAPFTCNVAPPPGNSLGAFNDIGSAAVGPIPQVSQNTPYEQTWTLGFQKQLPGKILLDANYVGKKGTHLYLGGFRDQNILPKSAIAGLTPTQIGALNNQVANPFFWDPTMHPGQTCDQTHYICNPASSLAAPQVAEFQLLLPHPQYTNFQGDSPPIANSIYHAVQIRAEKDFSNGLQFLATYTFAKSIDDASSTDDSVVFLGGGFLNTGTILSVQNPYDLRGERSESVFNIPHVFQFSYVYEFPLGRGKHFGHNMNPVLNAIVGGWQTNGIIRIDDGRPILALLFCQINFCNSGNIPTFGQRPDLTAPLLRASGSPEQATVTSGGSYFANGSVLATPANFTNGSAPRTISTVRQPGARDVSMSLFKEFSLSKVHEGARLQFRAESFNTFNHPHFAGPDSLVGSPTFGQITSTANDPRELQLALKVYF
ncbi:MAG TPA: TonB-dependent receptor [Candidatus Angelobacter sp.]|nr:TonB-dependent receptor [Candidatus Angelobacter sp.]